MKRVLLTGATGFIGRHCLQPLRERGYEVHAVTSRAVPEVRQDGIHWHTLDLLAPQPLSLEEIRPTHLLHLAWYAVPGKYWTSPENVRWVEASLALLRAFVAAGGTRAVLTGTCAEYDWTHGDGLCSEASTPLRPATLYGVAKRALGDLSVAYAQQVGLSLAWGRIFFLYGPHEPEQRLVPATTLSLLRGQPARCTHGRQIRDFLHVEDVAGALVALLDSEATGPVNIASGEPVTLREIVEQLAAATGRPELIQLGALPAPAGEPPRLVADTQRLREEVGWSPCHPLPEGLVSTVNWWREHSAR